MLRTALFILLTLLFSMTVLPALSQSRFKVSGRVVDVSKAVPLPSVTIMTTSGMGTVTDSLGRYSIPVLDTDSIWFSYLGKPTPKYAVKSIPNINQFELSLHVTVTNLPAVTVKSPNYRMDSLQNRRDYDKYFNYQKPGLSPSINPDGRVGADLNELIGFFQFRRNKRMAQFRDRLIREEEEKYIDHRFSRPLIIKLTGLRGAELEAFMMQYRPSVWFVRVATDYEVGMYIKECFLKYRIMKIEKSVEEESKEK
ncbi:hypothetical protein EV199_3842 [Pseudobacter ginsenosidimutans]|uniref:Carboxypeptidase-like protein n=2 Tax=Pseudobacter ginsenosidimutans TaxID=661488 RepID=A0A4Q7MVA1_9BACT|nr:hypothetical protein EV199_3842 [Pseudobacter ginsenosidimutans]